MKIFELSMGRIKHYVAAEDEVQAYKQGTDPDNFPDINYMPFEINEVSIPGYTITVTPNEPEKKSRQRKTE
ncbi:hypothetical protein NYE59_01660 [Paenibacillus sp. FSL L8-0323]|uniref:hypothetical protein n=1 Tax=Paenibacillus sp. FSL L8-0323 TaxID=2975330 RepID=UPI0030F69ED3